MLQKSLIAYFVEIFVRIASNLKLRLFFLLIKIRFTFSSESCEEIALDFGGVLVELDFAVVFGPFLDGIDLPQLFISTLENLVISILEFVFHPVEIGNV